ncbi:MAG TPA: T9SS type A sorting domain-containing protein [bacterium]|nr:T9SS type A sorting domain-containing protein [bacterium]
MVVHVSDGYDSDSLKVIIRIESVNNPPRFLSPDFVSMLEGSDFMYTAHAVDPEGERISYNFQHVPYWISVNDSILTGTAPFITEPHRVDSFFVTASDGMHQITMKVTLNITKDQMGPRIVNISDITFSNNETYAIDLDTCVVDTTYISRQMTWDIIPKSPYLIIQLSKRFVTLRSGLWTGSALLEFKVANPAQKADSLTVTVTITSSTSVPEESIVPNTLTLKPNFPNPFNSATSIHYELPSAARVVLDVLNIRGVVEQTLIQKNQKEGPHSVIWDATDHPAGTYFIRLRAGNEIRIQKCIYLK